MVLGAPIFKHFKIITFIDLDASVLYFQADIE